MTELVPFQRAHLTEMLLQDINRDVQHAYTDVVQGQLEGAGAMTVMRNGVPLVCGGAVRKWEGSAYVWTLFNEQSKEHFVAAFRGIRKFLELQHETFERLEIAVPVGFDIAHRRAELLGFTREAEVARHYLPGGQDCSLYAMVKK